MALNRHYWISVTLMLAACGGSGEGAGDAGQATVQALTVPIAVADVGLMTPESVLHDEQADVYLVSNINGSPLDMDGNGFISRISPMGEVIDLKWIDGAAEGTSLDAPKGMALAGEVLYVTDITRVRRFDRNTGAQLEDIEIPGATFLNDLAPAADGGVWLTDTGFQAGESGFEPSGTDAIYHLTPAGEVHQIIANQELGNPNGIVEVDGAVWVVSWGSGELYRADGGSKSEAVVLPGAQLDGIVAVDGELMVSSWQNQAVYIGTAAGPWEAVVDSLESPADIGYDAGRGLLLVPMFLSNAVRLIPVG